MRPKIAVTVSRRSGWRIFPLFALNIWLAGGLPVRWQSDRSGALADVGGLIIGGGDDISPTLYGGTVMPEIRLDPERDALEARLVREATKQGIPILGVCRGAQIMNVALGGSLHQDAYAVYPSRYRYTVLPRKTVSLAEGSLLSRIAERNPIKVNALHQQANDRLAPCLTAVGHDEGGMVQAIEGPDQRFAVGVQWHPEHLFYSAVHRKLFRALIAAAAKDHPVPR